jgi:hypothetical protein
VKAKEMKENNSALSGNITRMVEKRPHFIWSLLVFGLFTTATLTGGKFQGRAGPQYYQGSGTAKMAKLLREIYDAQDFKVDPNKTTERAKYYRQILAQNIDIRSELKVRAGLATELLRSGESEQAVIEIEKLRALAKEKGIVLAPFFVKQIRELAAISNLRLGEQENCQMHHNRESCIFPIRVGGVHKMKRGSTGAISELSAILRDDPFDLRAKWLLNVANMTLGDYPQKVPAAFLIDANRFASEYDIKRFDDVAPNVGLDVTSHAGGTVMDDFDRDGFFDIMISGQNPLDQLRFFHNNADGTFSERTKEAGLTGEIGGLNIIHADYNNDGFPDVVVLRGGWWGENGKYPLSLLKNNGNGTFDDVTETAGMMSLHPTQTAVWIDYDNDGFLDLFVGHESSIVAKHPSQMFRNNGNGTFTETGEKLGLSDLGFVKGVSAGDFNNDGRMDLYVSVKGAKNRLFRNDGAVNTGKPNFAAWKFTDVTYAARVGEPLHSFATWFWDYDNDGWEDILVTGYYDETDGDIGAFQSGQPNKAETPRLYHNNMDGTFTDVTKKMKLDRVILAMGANFGDLDNDGWLDCYFGTGTPDFAALLPNKMFRNAGGKVFQDVTTSGGFGHLQKGHAIAFGDLNNDGAEDIFEVIGGAYPGDTYQSVLFANPGHANHWIALDLEGVKTNRLAIGTRIRVTANTPQGERAIYRTVRSGGSFGDSPFRQHIGLGNALAVKEVEISWPSGAVQRWQNLPMEQSYRVREGGGTPVVMILKKFAFANEHKMRM